MQGDTSHVVPLTIADTSSLIAKMQVGEETATRLKAGDAVRVLPDDRPGESFPGTINLVGRAADPQSHSVEVWVLVPNPGGRLRLNGVAKVVIAAQPASGAVIVPSSAVTLDATNGNSGAVMVVDDKSIAHEVHVTIGVRSGGRMQILSGLKGGETVVIEGNYGLPDGTKVAIAGAAAAADAAALAAFTATWRNSLTGHRRWDASDNGDDLSRRRRSILIVSARIPRGRNLTG